MCISWNLTHIFLQHIQFQWNCCPFWWAMLFSNHFLLCIYYRISNYSRLCPSPKYNKDGIKHNHKVFWLKITNFSKWSSWCCLLFPRKASHFAPVRAEKITSQDCWGLVIFLKKIFIHHHQLKNTPYPRNLRSLQLLCNSHSRNLSVTDSTQSAKF